MKERERETILVVSEFWELIILYQVDKCLPAILVSYWVFIRIFTLIVNNWEKNGRYRFFDRSSFIIILKYENTRHFY